MKFHISIFCILGLFSSVSAFKAPSLSIVPRYFKAFDFAGVGSFGIHGTSCRDDVVLLPGIVPGMKNTMKLQLSAHRSVLRMLLESEFFYDDWNRLQVPLFKLYLDHETARLNFGDMYENQDPLCIYRQNMRGAGLVTSFEVLDDFLKISMKFRLGRSRSSTAIYGAVPEIYNVTDSVGVYSADMGLARFEVGDALYRKYTLAFVFLHMEDNTTDTPVDTVLSMPRRNRIYGIDVDYRFPEDIADIFGRFYLSSLRENTSDENVTEDIFDKAVVLGGRGRYGEYGYRGKYMLVGKKYYTGGNPYLHTDKHGLSLGGNYIKKGLGLASAGLKFYRDNLDSDGHTPTRNTISSKISFNLKKKRLPSSYATLRFKKVWSDSVVVDIGLGSIGDAGIQPDNTKKYNSTSTTFSLGGDYTYGKNWFLAWTDLVFYSDNSHYEHLQPAPAPTTQWIMGVRNRMNVLKDLRVYNGANLTFTGQDLSEEGQGIDEKMLYFYSSADYRFRKYPVSLTGGLGFTAQISDLPVRDYRLLSLELRPRYSYRNYLQLELGYKIKVLTGVVRDFTAHTFSLESKVVF